MPSYAQTQSSGDLGAETVEVTLKGIVVSGIHGFCQRKFMMFAVYRFKMSVCVLLSSISNG